MTQAKNTISLEELQVALIDNPEFLKDLVKKSLQRILDAQFENHIGANRYERTEERKGYRNGYYDRQIKTRVGKIELHVCRDREGAFEPQLFARYQRNEKALVAGLIEMYLKGVSTRKVDAVVEKLCGFEISKSQVSELVKGIEEEVEEWRRRPLEGTYKYLFVDALVHKVREKGKVENIACMIGVGIREDGYTEVIGCDIADSESEQGWSDFFKDLKRRGLTGLGLIISDQHAGLQRSIRTHFQGIAWQRCQVHFMRNFLGYLSKKEQGEWSLRLRDIFSAPEKEEAESRVKELVKRLKEQKKDKLATWVEENIEDTLTVYSFPESHRKKPRTTNIAERLNEEIRRRTTVIRIFPNRNSLMRILASECIAASERWMEKKYVAIAKEVKTA